MMNTFQFISLVGGAGAPEGNKENEDFSAPSRSSLILARNPALTGLGSACAIGIFWSLLATIFFTLPAMAAAQPKPWRESNVETL